jgi:hypothetical protein
MRLEYKQLIQKAGIKTSFYSLKFVNSAFVARDPVKKAIWWLSNLFF